MTNAQIQLLSIDVPITTYPDTNKKGSKSGKKGKPSFKSPSRESISRAADKWREKYEGKKTSISINDYV